MTAAFAGVKGRRAATTVDNRSGEPHVVAPTPVTRVGLVGRLDVPLFAVLGVASVWSLAFATLAVHRHETVRSHRFDLGNMVQAVSSTAEGRPLDVTIATGDQMSRLGIHVDPILALIAPLWLAFPTPALLIALQALALGAGAVAVFLLARRRLEVDAAAILITFAYLLNPSVVWNTLNDFHPVTLAIPLLLFAVVFLDRGRLPPFAACAALALMTGELVGLAVGALGLWYALARSQYRAGLVIAAVGFFWTTICLKAIVPAFSDGKSSVFYDHFDEVGGSPAGVLWTAISDPGRLLSAMTSFDDVRYLLLVLFPLLGVCLASSIALVAVPQLAVNLLAESDSATLPQYQYGAAALPFLFAAAVFVLAKLSVPRRPFVALAIAGASAVTLALLPPVPGREPFVFADAEPPARLAAIRAAVALVPDVDPVSFTNRIGGQLSDRRRAYSFPVYEKADWVIVDTRDPWLPLAVEGDQPQVFARELHGLARDARFRLVFERAGIMLYERRDATDLT